MRKSTGGLFCAFATRNSAHACDVCVCVCACAGREEETVGRQEGEKSVEIEEKSAHYITLARLPITPFKTFRALP